MKIAAILLSLTLLACSAVGQTAPKPALGKKGNAGSVKLSPPAPASLPTTEEVDSFLYRMFGQDPNVTWSVLNISATDSPGVAHVVVRIANQQAPIHLYVLPGGKNAIVGELIPYGADPFAPARKTLELNAKGSTKGQTAATVTLVEFSDLQCPHCRTAQPIIDRLISEMPNTKLIFQPFPLPMHKWATKAASIGECVAQQKQSAFWDYVDAVFQAQSEITDTNADEKLSQIASASGVDGAKAATCAESPQIYAKVLQSIELGKSVGVNATPTLFINGRKVLGIADMPFENLRALAAFEAAEAKAGK
jgi:protein-disulfide isomerase